jgi:hypothetical protein
MAPESPLFSIVYGQFFTSKVNSMQTLTFDIKAKKRLFLCQRSIVLCQRSIVAPNVQAEQAQKVPKLPQTQDVVV